MYRDKKIRVINKTTSETFENKTYNAQEINEYNNMNYNKAKKNIKDLFNPMMIQEV